MSPFKAKDYFSDQASLYAAFRPVYPQSLYEFIFSHLEGHQSAWDCATGNGQVAQSLSEHFESVHATDISQAQLSQAVQRKNINYSVSPAEKTSFTNDSFDLVTVGQALHWFERGQFYDEVNRVVRSGGLIAAWGYGLMYVEDAIDSVIQEFYSGVVGPYWDPARRLIENQYRGISFPFKEIPSPTFTITTQWTTAHLAGYLESWSATQKYLREQGNNPVSEVIRRLQTSWPEGVVRQVTFPVFLRLGRVA